MVKNILILSLVLLFIACNDKEKQNKINTGAEDVNLEKVITDTINNKAKSIVEAIDANAFSEKFSNYDRRELSLFLPITKVLEYTSLDERYYAVFTEDNVLKYTPDYPNSRINFYILKKINDNAKQHSMSPNFKVEHHISENNSVYTKFDKDNTRHKFLSDYCNFKDIDKNGSIDPIIVTQSFSDYRKLTNFYVFQGEQMIPLSIYSEVESINELYISPSFYTLSIQKQDYIKNTIANLNIIEFDEIDEVWSEQISFWANYETMKAYKGRVKNEIETPITVSKPSYTLDELKKLYESSFPKSQDVKVEFPVYSVLADHSGVIKNNTEGEVLLPDYQLDYIYVSQDNKVYKQTIYKNEFLLLRPGEESLIDDSPIYYDAYNGGYSVLGWDYQNGWESECNLLFPEDMPKGKYIAYTQLSYFNGEQKQALYSDKVILDYFRPVDLTRSQKISELKIKYDSLYPTSKSLVHFTGLSLFRKEIDGITDYFYGLEYMNESSQPINIDGAKLIFKFVDKDNITYTKEIEKPFWEGVLKPEEGDVLTDYNIINIVDNFWFYQNELVTWSPFPNDLPTGDYLIYSEIQTTNGNSYYSNKEYIEYFKPSFKSQKTDSLYQNQAEFYNEVAVHIPKNEENPNEITNCYKKTIGEYNVTTCYYPKQLKNKHVYAILREVSNEFIDVLPKQDTTYLSKYNDKVSFKLPKTETDTLKIKMNSTDYYIYKKHDFPVLETRFSLK